MAVGLDPWTCYTQQRDARSPVETACLYVNLFPNSNCASARRRLDRAACFRHFGAAAAAPALPTGDGHSGVRRCSSAGSTVSLDGSWSTLQDVTGACLMPFSPVVCLLNPKIARPALLLALVKLICRRYSFFSVHLILH
jgi:hypothetical protein